MFEVDKEPLPPVTPLNQELYADFSIEELEERLETGPWFCGEHSEGCVRHNGPSETTLNLGT